MLVILLHPYFCHYLNGGIIPTLIPENQTVDWTRLSRLYKDLRVHACVCVCLKEKARKI